MLNKKYILPFLFSLLVFLSASGNTVPQKNSDAAVTTESAVKNSYPTSNEELFGIDGLLQTSIRVNESNIPTFETFKNNKKEFNNKLFLKYILRSQSFYISYRSGIINNTGISPFYIAYHRLLI